MFKLISKIDNVRDYVIYKGKPYYINTSHEFQCGEKKQMLYKMPLDPIIVFNNKFYFSEWENNYKIFDENLELIEEGKDRVFYKLSEFYIAYNRNGKNTILIDKKDNLIELEYIDRSSIRAFSNKYIDRSNKLFYNSLNSKLGVMFMKFYSYDYVLSQISQQNWTMIIVSTFLVIVTGFFAFKAFKDKRGSKFRELSLISILTLIAFVLISITNFQNSQSNDNQFRSSLHFIEIVSKELGVDKKDIYVNTSATTDGAIIKVGDNFYRAISGTDQDSYLLEKMDLYKTDVELVEVEK